MVLFVLENPGNKVGLSQLMTNREMPNTLNVDPLKWIDSISEVEFETGPYTLPN